MEEQQFTSAQNVIMFVDMLRTEGDPTKRNTIKSLLLEEVNKFANRSEQLRHLEHQITVCRGHIIAQHKLIDRLRVNGSDCQAAERLLSTLSDLLHLFRYLRQTLVDQLDRAQF